MKKSLFYFILVALIIALPVQAKVTVEESTDAEYLINAGYSQVVAEDVHMLKNRVNGKSIEPLYEQSNSSNKFVKYWRKLYAYLDPAQDSQ